MAESRTQRRGLGRGLGSLIQTTSAPERDAAPADEPESPTPEGEVTSPGSGAGSDSAPELAPGMTPVPGASFAELPVDRISPNAAQPRQVFDEEAMAELVYSIREIGLLQP